MFTKIFFIIRLDDICPTMDWGKFRHLKSIFIKYNIKPLIGIVPDNKDIKLKVGQGVSNKLFWDEMRDLVNNHGWQVAMHGYQHKYINESGGVLGISYKSEFSQVPLKEQYEKLSLGKSILEQQNISANIFMAPSHSFDKNTITVLKRLGFQLITDGYGLFPYRRNSILFIPQLISKPIAPFPGIYTICLHSNSMNIEDINKIEKHIINNNNKYICISQSVELFNKMNYSTHIYAFISRIVTMIILKTKRYVQSLKILFL